MKKFIETVPFLLLIISIFNFYFFGMNYPSSLIVLFTTGLCGYRMYAMDKEKPDYIAMFQESFESYKIERDLEIKQMQERHEKAILFLEEKYKNLEKNYAKASMDKAKTNTKTAASSFVF